MTTQLSPSGLALPDGSILSAVNYFQIITSSGIWNKPSWATGNHLVVIDGFGGGAAACSTGSIDLNRWGSTGGGGGAYIRKEFLASSLPSSLYITVGASATPNSSGNHSGVGNSIGSPWDYLYVNGGLTGATEYFSDYYDSGMLTTGGLGGIPYSPPAILSYAGGKGAITQTSNDLNFYNTPAPPAYGGVGGASYAYNNYNYFAQGGNPNSNGNIPGGGGGCKTTFAGTQGSGARGEIRIRIFV